MGKHKKLLFQWKGVGVVIIKLVGEGMNTLLILSDEKMNANMNLYVTKFPY